MEKLHLTVKKQFSMGSNQNITVFDGNVPDLDIICSLLNERFRYPVSN